jgi:glutaredoxin 2
VLRADERDGVVKLFMFEHCSLCFRVRMTAALKRASMQESVVRDDDTETMVGLVGRRVVPILLKDDGAPMLDSMAMVNYIDSLGAPILVGPQRAEIADWAERVVAKTAPLTMPRYPLLGLPEFATAAAREHYVARKYKTYGDFAALRAKTPSLIGELMPALDELDALIESPQAVSGALSLDDIHVLPLLRSAAVVKDLTFPRRVRDYFETMMRHIGFTPLPAV